MLYLMKYIITLWVKMTFLKFFTLPKFTPTPCATSIYTCKYFWIRLVCLISPVFCFFEMDINSQKNINLQIWCLRNVLKQKPKPCLLRNNPCRIHNFTLVVLYLISQSAWWFSENKFSTKNYVNNKWQKVALLTETETETSASTDNYEGHPTQDGNKNIMLH